MQLPEYYLSMQQAALMDWEGGEETEPDSFGHLTHTYKYFRADHTCRDVAVKVYTKSGLTLLSNPPNILIPSLVCLPEKHTLNCFN